MELWKDVKGYEGLYQVSNYGNVRSVTRKREVSEKKRDRCYEAMVQGTERKKFVRGEYLTVVLSKNSKKSSFSVHRLVAEAFIPNPYNLPQVNHKDENKLNNNAENLEWVTAKQNMNYGTLPERRKHRKTRATPVIQYDKDGNFVAEYRSIVEASRITGVSKANIENYLTRNSKLWKRKNEKVKRRKVQETKK